MSPLVAFIWLISVIVATLVGRRKGHIVWGFFSGLFASWLGVLVVSLSKPSHAEMVRREEEHLRVQHDASGKVPPLA
jgi:hypothetical protein